jgi:menaquinone-dependent protoporphyrinogen oxidase
MNRLSSFQGEKMSNPNRITRRNFLKLGCAALGGTVLACGGLTFFAARAPDVPPLNSTFGEANQTGKRVLVAYATRAGSTVQVAETIAQTLGARGAKVNVKPVASVSDLTGYAAVIIGSAIRIGAWLPEAVEFVKANQATLSKIPTAYFVVSAFMRDDTPEVRQKVSVYLDPVRRLHEPKSVGLFAGKMDYGNLSLLDRFVVTNVAKVPEGDWRDWNKIRAWAEGVSPTL